MNKLRFIVESISEAGLVIGQNTDLDIPLESLFTSIERTQISWNDHEDIVEEVAEVNLIVREVHWCQRRIDAVPGGHAAGIALEGDGLDRLAGLLRDRHSGEWFSLVGAASANA